MVKIRSLKFGAAEKSSQAVKKAEGATREVNRTHLKLKLRASAAKAQTTTQLRDFQQEWYFADVIGMSDAAAKALLKRFEVLPERTPRSVHCWVCGSAMSALSSSSRSTGASDDTLQCDRCLLPGRLTCLPCQGFPVMVLPKVLCLRVLTWGPGIGFWPRGFFISRHRRQLKHASLALSPFWKSLAAQPPSQVCQVCPSLLLRRHSHGSRQHPPLC